MKRVTIILSITAVMTLIGCKKERSSESHLMQRSKEIRVETIIATSDESEKILNYSGIIVPYMKTSLSFRLPGMVERIYVDEGDQVRKDQILAELDKATIKSSYEMALAMQYQAQDAYDRLKKVYDKGSLPEIQWEEIKSQLKQANSSLEIASQNLEKTVIISPKSGIIGSKNTEVGSNVAPGISVFDLLTINKVYVRISVPENEISIIKKNQIALITIPAVSPESVEARVEKIGVVANMISKTYEVKLIMENRDLKIKPVMACDINLSAGNDLVEISVPYRAVGMDSNDCAFIYKVERSSSKAIKQEVEVSEFSNNEVKITSGITVGDLVVVNGRHKLHDNADVIF